MGAIHYLRPTGHRDSPRAPAYARRGCWEGPYPISRPTARYSPESAARRETPAMCLDTSQLNLGILLDVYFHCTPPLS